MSSALPRLLVLSAGFGGFNLIKHLKDDYEITVVSPHNHFLFTPLLPSTTVGTIEFRSIIEPIRYIRDDLHFYHAYAVHLDVANRKVTCRKNCESQEQNTHNVRLVESADVWEGH